MRDFIFLLFLGLYLPIAYAEFSWPTFHHAPGMEIDWTADRMIYNGMPMKVESFKCDCSAQDLLDYYRARWEKERKQVVENNLGTFRQIAYGDRKYFHAVMVKPDSRNPKQSSGRITISEIPSANQKSYMLGAGVPQTGDTRIINDVHDAMPGKRSRTVLMSNSRSVQQNYEFYSNYYQAKGWKSYLRPINPSIGAQAISYSKGNRDINIVIHTEGGESQILFNEVTEVR